MTVLSTQYSGIISTAFLVCGIALILAGVFTCAIAAVGFVATFAQLRPLLVIVSCVHYTVCSYSTTV